MAKPNRLESSVRPRKFWKGSIFSSGDGDHGLSSVLSRIFLTSSWGAGQALGQGGGRNVRDY